MQVTLLTDDQIRKLDRASIEILETIGVHLPQEEMLGRFQEASEVETVAFSFHAATEGGQGAIRQGSTHGEKIVQQYAAATESKETFARTG